MKNNVNRWTRKAFIKIIIYASTYTFLLLFSVLIGRYICASLPWSNNFLLHFLSWVNNQIVVIVFSFLFMGYLVIVYVQLKRAYINLDEVTSAIKSINDNSTDYIQLNDVELKEINEILNQTKSDIQLNQRAAKEAEQRKNDLVVYLAHDLKTPLTSIIGYLSLLRDEREISSQLQERYLNITLDKAERLEDLINEFFEITRFNLTEQVLEISRVDIVRLLEQLTYEFKPMLDEKHLKCHLQTPKQLEIKCDIQKIQRVLDNLLRNAVNYSFENTEISIILEEKDENIIICFENRGNTIPEEKLLHIFEQFFRLDSSRTSQTGGAGLGLSIAKEIIEQHGGTITAKSYDEKIIFEVNIPRL